MADRDTEPPTWDLTMSEKPNSAGRRKHPTGGAGWRPRQGYQLGVRLKRELATVWEQSSLGRRICSGRWHLLA